MRRLSFHDYFVWSLLLLSVFLASYPLNVMAKVVDRIVAVVNDDIILLSELDTTFKPYKEKIKNGGYPPEKEQQMLYRVREDLINKMVEQKLTEQEVKAHHIRVSENEIDQMIERIKQINYLTNEDLKKELETRGVTLKDYRKELKEQSLRNKLMVREVNSKIVVTKSDIKKYYDEHPKLYGGKVQYHLRNIFLKYPSNTSSDPESALKKRFDPVMEKLKSGEAFETVARQYSEASSASDGGDLGKFSLDTLSGQIKKNIENLSAGDYTPILKSDKGGQIIFIEEIVQDGGKPLKTVSAEIEQKLYKEIVEKRFSEWMDGLRARSHIKIIR